MLTMATSSNHEFIRRQFYIPRDHAAFLRDMAYKKNISQASIVRAALRAWAKFNTNTELSSEPKL